MEVADGADAVEAVPVFPAPDTPFVTGLSTPVRKAYVEMWEQYHAVPVGKNRFIPTWMRE